MRREGYALGGVGYGGPSLTTLTRAEALPWTSSRGAGIEQGSPAEGQGQDQAQHHEAASSGGS